MIEKTVKKVMPGQPGTKKLMKNTVNNLSKWHKDKTLWELPYGEAVALGLEERIVSEIPDNRN